ncbi:MAG: DUF6350 family protein [Microbacteriaceae bacterium]
MRRVLSASLAIIDALAIVAVGLAVALIPATILWGVQFGFAANFAGFFVFSENVWLLGHGVDVTVMLDPVLSAQLGLGAAVEPIRITIVLLGIGLLTAQMSLRAGRRAALADAPVTSYVAAIVVVAVLSVGIVFTAASSLSLPSRPQGVLLPTAIVAVSMFIGVVLEQRRRGDDGWLDQIGRRISWLRTLSTVTKRDLGASLAGGVAVAASILTVAALALAVMIALNYATVVGLYQSLQAGILGGSVVTLAQLVLLPNFVVWAAAWIVGAGFSIGAGTAVSPAGTLLGPVPGLPLFGAVPQVTGQWGFIVLLVPLLLSFIVAMVLRQRHDRYSSPATASVIFSLAGGIAVVAAVILALLSWWAGGAIGPGRMASVGPDPLAVASWTAALVFIGASVGGYAGRLVATK